MSNLKRRLAAYAVVALGLGLTAACGGGGQPADAPASSQAAASPASGFPVTITHKLGTTTVPAPPKRVVALGETDQDTLLALGVQPVGMAELTGIQPDGLTPWSAPKISGTPPKLLKAGEAGFSIEEIAALRPDLILAAGDYYIDKEYANLSKLAPTVAYETGPAEDTWQSVARQVAKAVGKPAEGDKLVADVEGRIGAVKEEYPELAGKSFALTSVFPSGNIGVLKSAADTSVKLFGEFGLVLPEQVKALPGEGFAAELSMEKVKILDVDVLLSHYNDDPATQRKIEANKLFAGLDVVKRGSYVPLDLKSFWPLRTPTPLAVPYVIDQIVPKVAKAASSSAS
ncbi:iron-siderophore ABC transporter substrate-binding protein [Spongiactinospora sp. TRM90649]|uniref:iron-siderophore ABC transporter substrate-binding protein n=1 Tax=Spongiactinospora sp. TRM90649 TaxID=3031114 RepID=UPI0023FA2D0B|nr:iron-siderophore ABC transporter substrate-binding protein [Spongiactinospora sp. TRM90649]MDF5758248.1 iron-siderophore ABC transporter substrate-binding protein [Spongiactinospora sp. TRM90649]